MVELYRAWEARFPVRGRRRRAEARWRGDKKVDKVWWRWGRRLEGPPFFGCIRIMRELWWRMRAWWEWMEYRRRVLLWWEHWRGVVEVGRRVRLCDMFWTCASCGDVEWRLESCADCSRATCNVIEEEEAEQW